MKIEPCCYDGNNVPMETPVTVTVMETIEDWVGVTRAVYRMEHSLTARGFAIASLTGGTSEDGRVMLSAEIETLDPCPYMVRALLRRAEAIADDPVKARGREPTETEMAMAAAGVEGDHYDRSAWTADGEVKNRIR